MKKSVWTNVKILILPRYFVGVFGFLGLFLPVLPKALDSRYEYAPWILLLVSGSMGLFVELLIHPVSSWCLVKFGVIRQRGFLPEIEDNENPLVIGGSISPRGSLVLTNKRLIIRIPGAIRESLWATNWKETKSIFLDTIVSVDLPGVFGKMVLKLSDGRQRSLRIIRRDVFAKLIKKMVVGNLH